MTTMGQSFADPGINPYVGNSGGGDVTRNADVNLNANAGNYNATMNAAAASTDKVGASVSTLLTKIENLYKFGGKVLKITAAVDFAGMTGAVASAASLQAQMSTLAATAAVNGTSLKAFGNDVNNTFVQFPAARSAVVALVTQITNLGIKGTAISTLAATFIKLGEATGEAIPGLTSDLIGLSRAMGSINPTTITGMANALVVVSKNAGVSATDVLNFANSIAPIAKQAGIGEAAVLGISAAFVKAGADGAVAGNALNSMVSDITTLTRTGSPDLIKYASLIGDTVAQFKKLPAASQISDVFSAIAKGGPQALNFLTSQGMGIRQLSAFQAVANLGGLAPYIRNAEANQTGSSALNRGASAATAGLDAQVSMIHNQITAFVTMLGAPLLRPVTAVAHAFEGVLAGMNSFIHALGPIPTIIGSALAPLALVAGVALAHAPLLYGASLINGMRVGPSRDAFNAGRAGEEMDPNYPLRSRGAYYAGKGVGTFFPASEEEEEATGRSTLGRVLRSPFDLGTWYNNSSRTTLQSGSRWSRWSRSKPTPAGSTSTESDPGDTTNKVATTAAAENAAAMEEQAAATRKLTQATVEETDVSIKWAQAATEATAATAETTTAMQEVTSGLWAWSKSLFGVAADTALLAPRLAGGALMSKLPGSGSGMSMMAGFGLGMGGQYLGKMIAGNSAAGSAQNAVGTGVSDAGTGAMIGGMFGWEGLAIGALAGGLLGGVKSLLGAGGSDTSRDITSDLNPIMKYNQLLGTTASNLANFSTAVNQAAAATTNSNIKAPTTLAGAAVVNAATVQAAQGKKVTSPVFTALSNEKGNTTSAAVAAIQGMAITQGGMTPDLMGAIRNDLINTYGGSKAQTILNAYLKTNPAATATSAVPSTAAMGTGLAGARSGSAFKTLAGADISGIQARALSVAGGKSPQAELAQLSELVAKSGVSAGSDRANSLAAVIAGVYGLDPKKLTFATKLNANQGAAKNQTLNASDLVLALEAYDRSTGSTDGARALKLAGINPAMVKSQLTEGGRFALPGASSSLSGAIASLTSQYGSPAAAAKASLSALSPTGAAVAKLGIFADASGGDAGNPAKTQEAVEAAAAAALKLGANSSAASAALQELADNTSGASSAILQSASTWARTKQSEMLPMMSQEQQGAVLAQNLTTSTAAARQPNASAQAVSTYQGDQQAFATYQQQQQQRFLQMGQALDQFHMQQERSEQQYDLQVYRSNQAFQIQMTQSEQAYYLQRSRTIQDFNISQARAAQSAAESIYNPYATVQAESVVSAGQLASNLEDQNQRIEQQLAQVKQLRAEGLSQNAIDTLQLDDPSNAQQTNAIAETVMGDPNTIAQINKLVGTRVAATTALTQSNYNVTFRDTVADFKLGLDRTAQDYNIAKDQAVQAQDIALGQMAQDFNISVTQAGQDLTLQMTELYGTLADVFPKTLQKINTDIGKQFPQLAKMLTGEINQTVAAVTAGTGSSPGGGNTVGPLGSESNPITTAGTMGINSSGVFGSYNSKGKFVADPGSHAAASSTTYIAKPQSANTPAGARAYAQSRLKAYGWGQDQFAALDRLWTNESGWRYSADNASSGAYGIPQALPADKMASAGSDWRSNGKTQIEWGLGYIASRYGSPDKASAFEFSHTPHWYSAGSIMSGAQIIGVGEAGPEMVLPLDQRGAQFMTGFYDQVSQALAARMNTMGRGMYGSGAEASAMGNTYQDYSTYYTGDIKLTAQSPAEMERKLAQRKRLKALASPPK